MCFTGWFLLPVVPRKTKPLHVMGLISVTSMIQNIPCVRQGITVPEETSCRVFIFAFMSLSTAQKLSFSIFSGLFAPRDVYACLRGWGLL